GFRRARRSARLAIASAFGAIVVEVTPGTTSIVSSTIIALIVISAIFAVASLRRGIFRWRKISSAGIIGTSATAAAASAPPTSAAATIAAAVTTAVAALEIRTAAITLIRTSAVGG